MAAGYFNCGVFAASESYLDLSPVKTIYIINTMITIATYCDMYQYTYRHKTMIMYYLESTLSSLCSQIKRPFQSRSTHYIHLCILTLW